MYEDNIHKTKYNWEVEKRKDLERKNNSGDRGMTSGVQEYKRILRILFNHCRNYFLGWKRKDSLLRGVLLSVGVCVGLVVYGRSVKKWNPETI